MPEYIKSSLHQMLISTVRHHHNQQSLAFLLAIKVMRQGTLDRSFQEQQQERRFQELKRRFQELERRFQELKRRFQELERRFQELERRFQELERSFQELERSFQELERNHQDDQDGSPSTRINAPGKIRVLPKSYIPHRIYILGPPHTSVNFFCCP